MGGILLLEDDSHYRDIIERVLLRHFPLSVTPVATEMQAREELSKGNFDVVLLDLNINGRRCWETLKRVLHHPAKPVAIVLSGEDTRRNVEYAMSLGAYAFLSKPINFLQLKMTIESALQADKRDASIPSALPGSLPE